MHVFSGYGLYGVSQICYNYPIVPSLLNIKFLIYNYDHGWPFYKDKDTSSYNNNYFFTWLISSTVKYNY